MKKYLHDTLAVVGIIFLISIFFYKTICFGLLPVPSDTLVGLYHPWRDVYAQKFPNGVPFKNFLITDPIREQIPWRKQVIDALKNKKLPLWDATSFSGVPLLGNIQSGALYPLNMFFFIFSFEIAWTILIISQPLLAGIFLYIFLRHKKLEPVAALVGAICFAFSGFSISWLTWGTMVSTFLWVPLMLFAIDKIHTNKKPWRWRALFLFALSSSFFAGHLQLFIYGVAVVFWYAFWEYWKTGICKIRWWHGIVLVLFFIVTGIQWIPLLQFLPTTSRITSGAAYLHEGFFMPIQHLIQFIIPDYFGNPATLNYWGTWNYGEMVGYIGVVGMVLAGVGISTAPGFWAGMVCIALLFAIDSPLARLPFTLHIPGISSLQPTRLLAIVDFGLSILAAYGMATLMAGAKKKQILMWTILLSLVFVGAWMSVLVPSLFGIPIEHIAVVKRNLILPSIVFVVLMGGIWVIPHVKKFKASLRYVWAWAVIILLSCELIRFGWKFTPFTDASFFFPKTEIITRLTQLPKPFRVLVVDDRLLPPNVLSFYTIESVSGYDPIHTLRYEEYIAAMERGEPNITPPFGFTRIIAPKTITSPLLSLLNVHYILSIDPLSGNNVQLLAEEGTTKLYTYLGGIPRVYLAEQIITEYSKEGVMRKLYDPSFIPGRTAVVESPISLVSAPIGIDESAVISSYEGDRLRIQTITKNPRLLVIANMMDSHWEATIDGKRTGIVRVNYLFTGIQVGGGKHTIELQYRYSE